MSETVRPLAFEDVPDVLKLVEEFAERAQNPAGFSADAVADFLELGLHHGCVFGFVARRPGGSLAGAVFGIEGPDWLSDKKIAQEHVWYVRPGGLSGLALMRAFEAEAFRRGAEFVLCGCVSGFMQERLAKVLEHLDYNVVESWWVKGAK